MKWHDFVTEHWSALCRGEHIVASGKCCHPSKSDLAFEEIIIAEPAGQKEDWALSLNDGSRLHVHVFDDSTYVLHRDKIDPSKSIFHALGHYVVEAPSAKALAIAGALWTGVKVARKLKGL